MSSDGPDRTSVRDFYTVRLDTWARMEAELLRRIVTVAALERFDRGESGDGRGRIGTGQTAQIEKRPAAHGCEPFES